MTEDLEPATLTEKVKGLVNEELKEITDAKFGVPSEEEYEKARKLSRGHGSDGSLASKAGRGAPPSADNNV